MNRTLSLLCIISLAACGHASAPAPATPASFAAIPTEPTTVGALYATCLAASASTQHYGRAHDDDTNLLLFTCDGDAAKAFYDALGPYAATIGSEVVRDGVTYRPTQVIRRNLYGVDYCQSDGATYACTITLNAGAFLR